MLWCVHYYEEIDVKSSQSILCGFMVCIRKVPTVFPDTDIKRSSPQEVLQSKLMRLIAVHAVKHKNAEEEPKQPIVQLHFIPTCSLSGTLCEHKWNTHKFAESGQRRQIKVDPRKKVLLSPYLS